MFEQHVRPAVKKLDACVASMEKANMPVILPAKEAALLTAYRSDACEEAANVDQLNLLNSTTTETMTTTKQNTVPVIPSQQLLAGDRLSLIWSARRFRPLLTAAGKPPSRRLSAWSR